MFRRLTMTYIILLVCGTAHGDKDWPRHVIDGSSRGADGVKLRDINGDGRLDITTGWEEGGLTRVYLHPGPKNVRAAWPAVTVGKTRSAEDAVFVDLDRDGRHDVVSCCEGKQRSVFVHWSPTREKLLDPNAWQQQVIPASQDRMMWMFAIPMQINAGGPTELVAAGKGEGAQIGWFEVPPDGRSIDRYRWHPVSAAGWVMSLFARDMDGDGDLDIVTSDRRGNLRGCRWLENPGAKAVDKGAWTNHFIGGRDDSVWFGKLVDFDGDELEDMLVAAEEAQVIFFRRLDASGRRWQERRISFPENMGRPKAVAVGDIDRDGCNDLVLSSERADPPKSGITWISYGQDLAQPVWSRHEISGPEGIKFDRIELTDLDGDGDLDVLTCEERHEGRGIGVFWHENPSLSP